nr:MAG TPA: tail fiber protein [Caudoviricetes sp.]
MEERNQDNFNQMESHAKYPWSSNWSLENHYQPWYDDRRDYNTNAPSYYDYLANTNRYLDKLTWLTNRVARRNINVQSTNAIHYTKEFDWIDEGKERGINWHDIINLKCELVLSKLVKRLQYQQLDGTYKYLESSNSLIIENDGLYNPDVTNYLLELNKDVIALNTKMENLKADILRAVDEKTKEFERRIDEKINNIRVPDNQNQQVNETKVNELIDNKLTEIKPKVDNINRAVEKIVYNLNTSGATDGTELATFNIISNIAHGNINIYTTENKQGYITTRKIEGENDLWVK